MDSNRKNVVVVYGGSFDPPTMGHLNVVQKIMKFADCLHLVVAVNPEKAGSSFSFDDRKELLLDYIATHLPDKKDNIVINSLPTNEFLASYANSVDAQLLVRGLRDTIDFTNEQKIDGTNKKIAPKLETIYVMPDAEYALVSSSWAKSLVGIFGWQNTLRGSVSPLTIKKLEERWLKKEFAKIFESARDNGLISPCVSLESTWKIVSSVYSKRPYHNLSHIARTLEACRYYYAKTINYNAKKKTLSELAIVFHDMEDTEAKSFARLQSLIGLKGDNVFNYIEGANGVLTMDSLSW